MSPKFVRTVLPRQTLTLHINCHAKSVEKNRCRPWSTRLREMRGMGFSEWCSAPCEATRRPSKPTCYVRIMTPPSGSSTRHPPKKQAVPCTESGSRAAKDLEQKIRPTVSAHTFAALDNYTQPERALYSSLWRRKSILANVESTPELYPSFKSRFLLFPYSPLFR